MCTFTIIMHGHGDEYSYTLPHGHYNALLAFQLVLSNHYYFTISLKIRTFNIFKLINSHIFLKRQSIGEVGTICHKYFLFTYIVMSILNSLVETQNLIND